MNERAQARQSIEPGTSGLPTSRMLQLVALAQALYYIPTGIWPLVSIGTFQQVTGPKTDLWLVKTVGLLISIVGAALTMAGLRRRMGPEIPLLGIGSAAALTAIDVVYVAKRRISPIYLLDALGEVVLIGGWIVALGRRR